MADETKGGQDTGQAYSNGAPPPPEELTVEALLRYDPFGNDSGPSSPEGVSPAAPNGAPAHSGGETPPAEGGQPSGASAAAATSPPAAATAAVPPSDIEALRREVQELRAFRDGLMAVAGASQAPPAAPDVEVPVYQYTIPDDLLASLSSEDMNERRNALVTMAANVSRYTHEQVIRQMRREFAAVIPRMVEHLVDFRDAAKEIANDFYGTYKQLDNPALRPIVEQTARAIQQERGYQQWGPEFRDEIARRVFGLLGVAAPAPQRPATPMVTPTARGAVPPAEDPFDF